jgi:hypothetical protein
VTGDLQSQVYSVASNRWIRVGDMPEGATLVSNLTQINGVVLDDGRVLTASGLAFGVEETNASLLFTPNYANLALGIAGEASGRWDFTRDTSGNVTRANGASEHHKLIKLRDGRVLLIHGNDHLYPNGRFGPLPGDTHGVQAELFDVRTGRWTALPDLPAITGEDDRHNGVKGVRQMAAAALLPDGRVLISGGFSLPVNDRGKPLLKPLPLYARSSAIVFDASQLDGGANPWSVTSPMAVARYAHVFSELPGNAGIISVGGWTAPDEWTASVERYDPMTSTWRFMASMPAAPGTDLAISLPFYCDATMPGGELLVAGGAGDFETQLLSRRSYLYRP